MITAAVLAGGSGTRMGTDIPKQYLEICGEPVIIRSIKAFYKNRDVQNIIVSVSENYIEYVKELVVKFSLTAKPIYVIKGGNTRGNTLFSVLNFMKECGFLDDSIVLTHDAVRPFINDRIIKENIESAKINGACNTCIPATDTVFISRNGDFIEEVLDRSTVFNAQTPQTFRAKKLYELILSTPKEVFDTLTDGCSVFTFHGEKVSIVKGENYNIKITYPDDIEKAGAIIKTLEK